MQATRRKIPILIDAERKREGLDELLNLATYVVCSAKFPQQLTEAPSVPTALVSMHLRLPNIKFLIVTLGEKGCMMLERSIEEAPEEEETDVESVTKSLKQKIDQNSTSPICIASKDRSTRMVIGAGEQRGGLYFLGEVPASLASTILACRESDLKVWHSGADIRRVRSDNDTEFNCLRDYFSSQGILSKHPV